MFNGQVMSWTTQDSQVPRIGLQSGRFPPICPEPGQKRHIGESAQWKRLATRWTHRLGHRQGCFIVWAWWWTDGRFRVWPCPLLRTHPGRGLGVRHLFIYSRWLWLGQI